jgi:hypothetical protein
VTLQAARAGQLPHALMEDHAMVAALVQRLLCPDPLGRPTADELLEHYALLFSAHNAGHASAYRPRFSPLSGLTSPAGRGTRNTPTSTSPPGGVGVSERGSFLSLTLCSHAQLSPGSFLSLTLVLTRAAVARQLPLTHTCAHTRRCSRCQPAPRWTAAGGPALPALLASAQPAQAGSLRRRWRPKQQRRGRLVPRARGLGGVVPAGGGGECFK